MECLEVISPVAQSLEAEEKPASRFPSLDGKVVGLYWNVKTGGDIALAHAGALLQRRYRGIELRSFHGEVGIGMRHATAADISRVRAECDVVITASADCGSCTSWLVRDAIEFEKVGLPSVTLTAAGFEADARRTGESFGIPGIPLAVVPRPFTNATPQMIAEMIDGCVEQIVHGLTVDPAASALAGLNSGTSDSTLKFEGQDQLEAAHRMNQVFIEKGWSDGLPLVPATGAAVDRMIEGARRRRDEMIAVLEPGFGFATVEKIAVAAVMAGCRPEHMPVLIAAVECIADPRINLRNKAMSTGTHTPLIVVNGPIRTRIGMNAGTCAFGPGAPSYANTVIGRALRLVMMNVGHTYPGISDMDTVGTPLKYSLCAAENEEASPWTPYHVEHGFEPTQSTVTVEFVYGISELKDFESRTPEGLIGTYATAITNLGQPSVGMWLTGRRADPRHGTEEKEHQVIVLCPDHVEVFHQAGWDKSRIREALFRAARLPYSRIISTQAEAAIRIAHPQLGWLCDSPDTLLPVVEEPGCYDIFVIGGTAGRGSMLHGAGGPVTKAIVE